MDGKLSIPTGDGKSQIEIDLGKILQAEARLDDVTTANPANCMELLAIYNSSWHNLQQTLVHLMREELRAQQLVDRRKAEAMLEADEELKRRGLKSTAELREAVVTINQEVFDIQERLDQIKVVHKLLDTKARAFLNAWQSVKGLSAKPEMARVYDSVRPEPMTGSGYQAVSVRPIPPRPKQIEITPPIDIDVDKLFEETEGKEANE